jgi:uncharacterized membrane protein YdjX (TVP38/TMEM64 family)
MAVAGLLLALLGVAAYALPVMHWLRAALIWTGQHRAHAGLPFIALYIVSTVCFLPDFLLTVAAGAIFGVGLATALVSAGSTLGATAAFFLGRTLARGWISRRISAWPRFQAVDHALGSRGFWIVFLTRLTPAFPYSLLNYAYGITAVRARDYILASWIGMLPGTVLYAYAGSTAASLTQALAGHVHTGAGGRVLLWAGLPMVIIVTVLVTRLAHRELEREIGRK